MVMVVVSVLVVCLLLPFIILHTAYMFFVLLLTGQWSMLRPPNVQMDLLLHALALLHQHPAAAAADIVVHRVRKDCDHRAASLEPEPLCLRTPGSSLQETSDITTRW